MEEITYTTDFADKVKIRRRFTKDWLKQSYYFIEKDSDEERLQDKENLEKAVEYIEMLHEEIDKLIEGAKTKTVTITRWEH